MASGAAEADIAGGAPERAAEVREAKLTPGREGCSLRYRSVRVDSTSGARASEGAASPAHEGAASLALESATERRKQAGRQRRKQKQTQQPYHALSDGRSRVAVAAGVSWRAGAGAKAETETDDDDKAVPAMLGIGSGFTQPNPTQPDVGLDFGRVCLPLIGFRASKSG